MSLLVTLTADILVAILLVATIVSSMRLSRRITKLKGDEAALRQTIGDLVTASATAERAIAGLRATLDECDRTLAERLGTAERYAADLSAHVEAGHGVIARIAAIVSNAQPGRPVDVPARAREPEIAVAPRAVPRSVPAVVDAPALPPASPNGERIGVAAAAALAMSERALGRLRSRAA
ncbi:DUF6468 domain-containing protein [Methylobacterium sp. Leaf466]|uniref:DUF6468 domain-containing protein n=1 Tax=Methylobacterium sp. Leaf466 TaxID=1736386 RepID=UPI0006FACFDA|nr:DUF6468 domain-containing protein [Methylobacterium sp. Leaf466]KQT78806.1 glutamyl-tRNA reductase [Methylobacterium sp. Leaf466]